MRTTELQAAKYISKNRKIKNAKPLIQPVTNMIILVSVFMTLSHLKTTFFKFFQCFFFSPEETSRVTALGLKQLNFNLICLLMKVWVL